jgi:hypothetical protein
LALFGIVQLMQLGDARACVLQSKGIGDHRAAIRLAPRSTRPVISDERSLINHKSMRPHGVHQ